MSVYCLVPGRLYCWCISGFIEGKMKNKKELKDAKIHSR